MTNLTERLSELAERVRAKPSGAGPSPDDLELRDVARTLRQKLASDLNNKFGPFEPLYLRAIVDVPRERYVRPSELERSARDVPLPLDDEGLATISAPHAYLLSFRLLSLEPGDAIVELGSGTGYGSALAAYIVGSKGKVLSFEIDEDLASRARALLAIGGNEQVKIVSGDAIASAASWGDARKVVCTFAVESLPDAWLEKLVSLGEGASLVAPVGPSNEQRLVRVVYVNGTLVTSDHGAVRYVKNRSPLDDERLTTETE